MMGRRLSVASGLLSNQRAILIQKITRTFDKELFAEVNSMS